MPNHKSGKGVYRRAVVATQMQRSASKDRLRTSLQETNARQINVGRSKTYVVGGIWSELEDEIAAATDIISENKLDNAAIQQHVDRIASLFDRKAKMYWVNHTIASGRPTKKSQAHVERVNLSVYNTLVQPFIDGLIARGLLKDVKHKADVKQLTVDQRWESLRDFAQANGGVGIIEFGKKLFPELGSSRSSIAVDTEEASTKDDQGLLLPKTAPEIYAGLRGAETPPEFVARVYGPWLGKGFDRGHVRQLDPKLYDAISNWTRKNEWPPEVDLPTRAAQNERLLASGKLAIREHLGKFTGAEVLREAARIDSMSRRRK